MIRPPVITLLFARCPAQVSWLVALGVFLAVNRVAAAWPWSEESINVRSEGTELVPIPKEAYAAPAIVAIDLAVFVRTPGFYPTPDAVERGFFVRAILSPSSGCYLGFIAATAHRYAEAMRPNEALSPAITSTPPYGFMASGADGRLLDYCEAVKFLPYRVSSYAHEYGYASVRTKLQH